MSPDIEPGQGDIRDQIFRGHGHRNVTAVVIAEAAGAVKRNPAGSKTGRRVRAFLPVGS